MGNINIEIPDDLHKRLKITAVKKDVTLKDFINDEIANRLRRKKR